ncbi:hypothetical protein [Janibacter cremeus]|uniref:SnoaL-like domain-containing protein n=1 Tax=Janibacter cremeus TaxID=1285192 RepID=A0A852VTY9_9MICO|nr:hypothetical protein [Janibacter cremeus]NYF98133.1 hypothetical protein [Janibacter cremeus]
MAAAREGDFDSLLQPLAPDAGVRADAAAITAGTPEGIDGRREIAEFFNGSAHAALPVHLGERPGAAWFHRGEAKVLRLHRHRRSGHGHHLPRRAVRPRAGRASPRR